MNPRITETADAIAVEFVRMKTDAVMFPLDGENKFPLPVPDEKFDKEGWKEFTETLKFRHKLEAYRQQTNKNTRLLVCAYGFMSNAPKISEEEVDKMLLQYDADEKASTNQYNSLMGRLTK